MVVMLFVVDNDDIDIDTVADTVVDVDVDVDDDDRVLMHYDDNDDHYFDSIVSFLNL